MNRIFCIFSFHSYKPVAVHHYYDTSYGDKAQSTNVTLMCSCCGKMKTQSLYASGFLEIEDLRNKKIDIFS